MGTLNKLPEIPEYEDLQETNVRIHMQVPVHFSPYCDMNVTGRTQLH